MGAAHVELRQEIHIVTNNLDAKPIQLLKSQQVAVANIHSSAITESSITHAQEFDIEEHD